MRNCTFSVASRMDSRFVLFEYFKFVDLHMCSRFDEGAQIVEIALALLVIIVIIVVMCCYFLFSAFMGERERRWIWWMY